MQQNFSKEFSGVVWGPSGYWKRSHMQRLDHVIPKLWQWPVIINLLLHRGNKGCIRWQFLHWHSNKTLPKLICSWLEVRMKIHSLLCAFNPHFHLLTCHHHNKTPPSTTFVTEYITCSHSQTESSAVRIGTAFIIVSHMEATQAGEKMRGDKRECCCKEAHSCVEGVNSIPTSTCLDMSK